MGIWWLYTCLVVSNIWIIFHFIYGNVIIPTDEHIFQRGWNHQPGNLEDTPSQRGFNRPKILRFLAMKWWFLLAVLTHTLGLWGAVGIIHRYYHVNSQQKSGYKPITMAIYPLRAGTAPSSTQWVPFATLSLYPIGLVFHPCRKRVISVLRIYNYKYIYIYICIYIYIGILIYLYIGILIYI